MTIAEVKSFLSENAATDEVKAYLAELSKPSAEFLTAAIEDYKKSREYTSEVDSRISKAVEAHDVKAKPKFEAEMRRKIELELNPPKDPAVLALQEEMAALKQAKADSEALLNKQTRINKINSLLKPEYQELGKIIYSDFDNEEALAQYVNKTAFDLQTKVTKAPNLSSGTGTLIDRESLKTMSPEQINKARAEGRLDQILGAKVN